MSPSTVLTESVATSHPRSDDAFARLLAEHQTPLLRYVRRLLNSADDAEDVVQDAFLKLHRQLHADGKASVANGSAWLYRVAHNRAMDLRRKRKRRAEHQQPVADLRTRREADRADAADPADVAAERDHVQAALDELDHLPGQQQQIVRLKVMQGLTLREIADVMDMPLANVHYRLTKALGELAGRLKERRAI